jgi:hypothetical protein
MSTSNPRVPEGTPHIDAAAAQVRHVAAVSTGGAASTTSSTRVAIAAAVGSSLVVAAGLLWADWPVFAVMVLYWAENVLVGLANVVRMLIAGARQGPVALLGSLFMIAFFCVHYGLFTTIHGVFVLHLFGPQAGDRAMGGADPLTALGVLATRFADDRWLQLALLMTAALVLVDTLRWVTASRTAPQGSDVGKLMIAPYGRIVVLHVTLIIGGGLVAMLQLPAAAALLLVALKLGFDLTRLRRGPDAAWKR